MEETFRSGDEMKKYEILYDWPIVEIARLADSNEAEYYADQLEEPQQSQFVTLTERMRILSAELGIAKAARVHFTKWAELRSCIVEFGNRFENFPAPSVEKLNFSLLLAEKLSQSSPTLDTVDIDAQAFELRELTQSVPQPWFCRENSQSIIDSLIVFSYVDKNLFENEIALSIISPILLFYFMATLHTTITFPSSQAILVKKVTPQTEISAINAFARLVVLATGKPVHSARKYTNVPSILNIDEIRPGEPYQQWSEVLNVLSEYNGREEILIKFLTIYHVIENFMFKRPIVELERQKNGGMFSIRDFRRLYDSVEMREADALKKLFQDVFIMQASPGTNFKDHLVSRWNSLVSIVPETDINSTLTMIGLDFSFNAFRDQATLSCFSKLVYTIRNAIVHNKETEFHLTYASLNINPGLYTLMEKFLLPSLEEICFEMISKPNTEFWYQNKEIQLYS